MFVESARAVDNDMVGSDNDAELIGGVPDSLNACS